MAKKKYEEANIQAIAEAIREKTGTDNTYDTSEMADGVNEVYEAGKQKEWSDFWDAFQQKGKRTDYYYAFIGPSVSATGWDDVTFKPKYDIRPTNFDRGLRYSQITDLEGILERQGVVLDTSNCTVMSMAFQSCTRMKSLPVIDLRKAVGYAANVFSYMQSLTRIKKLIIPEDGKLSDPGFVYDTSLAHIEIEGVIGYSWSFSYSPLTVESIKNIITHLKDYSGTDKEYTYTLTLSSASKTALEAEGATSPNGNTWLEYIEDKGWNLK